MRFYVVLLVLATLAVASVGDRSPEFRDCVTNCIRHTCRQKNYVPPWFHRLLLWDCPQECDYRCQQIITFARMNQGQDIVQFHGKWPFLRFFGIQELASVVFSMANFIPHYKGWQMLKKLNQRKPSTLIPYYIGFAFVGMNSWVWSSVFHTRDFPVTEKLDYFSAGLSVLYGFFFATVRIFRLDQASKETTRLILASICVTLFLAHVSYLSFIKFDYGYNMMANVVVGALQLIMWSVYSFSQFAKTKELWTLMPFGLCVTISAAMGLELFDFPPWKFMVDAHSLWHAATVIPCFLWYTWMKKDLQYEERGEKQE